LAPLVLYNKKILYDLLFRTSAEALLEVARDPRHLGAEIGFFSVLHTWNQKLKLHPHAHCVVPAGGLSLDHTRWVRSPDNYFLPSRSTQGFSWQFQPLQRPSWRYFFTLANSSARDVTAHAPRRNFRTL
jgi:hypothetical protein